MRIILEHTDLRGQKVTIETRHDEMAIQEVINDLIRPALVAFGFHPNTVEEAFKND